MGDFFVTKNIDYLNDLYQNAEMGVVGIDDVLYKVKDKILKKELERERKEFNKIMKKIAKLLSSYKNKPKKINFMTKMSSEFYSEMKLRRENSDGVILKMMIEGSYKSVGIITTKMIENDMANKAVKTLGEKLLKVINDNIEKLKRIKI